MYYDNPIFFFHFAPIPTFPLTNGPFRCFRGNIISYVLASGTLYSSHRHY